MFAKKYGISNTKMFNQNPDGKLWSDIYERKFIFKDAEPFVEGLARVKLEDDTYSFVYPNGKFMKLPLFTKLTYANNFCEDMPLLSSIK